jgi:hypothetical protein
VPRAAVGHGRGQRCGDAYVHQADDARIEAPSGASWGKRGIWEATALTAFFNFPGRMEAASGLPPDEVPADAHPKEAKPDAQGVVELAKGSP